MLAFELPLPSWLQVEDRLQIVTMGNIAGERFLLCAVCAEVSLLFARMRACFKQKMAHSSLQDCSLSLTGQSDKIDQEEAAEQKAQFFNPDINHGVKMLSYSTCCHSGWSGTFLE